MSRIDLRSYVFLDSLQPQYSAFLSTVAQGFLPLAHDASLFVDHQVLDLRGETELEATLGWPDHPMESVVAPVDQDAWISLGTFWMEYSVAISPPL